MKARWNMAKRVFKGWCIPEYVKKVAFWSDGWDGELKTNIYKDKGRAADYHPDSWPPKRVTVTVEVEE